MKVRITLHLRFMTLENVLVTRGEPELLLCVQEVHGVVKIKAPLSLQRHKPTGWGFIKRFFW